MNPAPNLVLVGPMGAGKSSVGRRLAERFGLAFADADREIERLTGASVTTIFECEGEAGFRARETQAIAELTALDGIVLATGGGVVLAEENRSLLAARGTVVYLRATPEHLYERVRQDRNRPLLATGDPLGRLRELYRERDPLYRAVADLVIDTGRQSVQVLARGLLEQLGAQWKASA